MAITINGTTGVAGVDGSASTPAVQGTDTNTGVSFGADTVNINTGGTTRATLDSSGRMLLGTTDVGASGVDNLILNRSGNGGLTIRNGVNNNGNIFFSDGTSGAAEYAGYFQYQHAQDTLVIGTSGSERMRLDSVGCLQINQTSKQYSDLKLAITGSNSNVAYFDTGGSGNNYAITVKHGHASSGQNGIGLRFLNSGGTEVGKIDWGQSTTQYRTSSDYRLKENATAISDGITRLKTLKPYQFNWIAEKGQPKVDGFFAHEVTAVPEAISGTKDQVDSDNKPLYQSIDHSKLVPLLTAALQEAITKIETLETKVAELEAA